MKRDTKLSGLYAITDRTLCGNNLIGSVEQALQGGARIVQYRDKSNDSERRTEEATQLARLCHEYNAISIINDDIKLARRAGADGVHLGQDDGSMEHARSELGTEAIIGISCYNDLERAIKAQQNGADYIAFGRFFPSSTKPNAIQADLSLLQQASHELDLPTVAIGGITPENGRTLTQAGADMLAVIHAVFGQDDITAACKQFTTLFDPEDTRP